MPGKTQHKARGEKGFQALATAFQINLDISAIIMDVAGDLPIAQFAQAEMLTKDVIGLVDEVNRIESGWLTRYTKAKDEFDGAEAKKNALFSWIQGETVRNFNLAQNTADWGVVKETALAVHGHCRKELDDLSRRCQLGVEAQAVNQITEVKAEWKAASANLKAVEADKPVTRVSDLQAKIDLTREQVASIRASIKAVSE